MTKNKVYLEAILELIKTGHWITDQVGLKLKEYGLTEPQYNVMRILRGQKGKPTTVHYISQQMIQRSSNVTRIIDKLIEKELVSRAECPGNRRKMDILLTHKGANELKRLDKVVENFHSPLIANLTENEAKHLKDLIIKLKGE